MAQFDIEEIIVESVGQLNSKTIVRVGYEKWMRENVNNDMVKVVVGFRRIGKSVLMKQLYYFLLEKRNIPKENLFFVNYEHVLLNDKRKASDLYRIFEDFEARSDGSQRIFLFLDEIQNVKNWESFVRTLHEKDRSRYCMYISGSNSSLLSSEFSSVLGGRTVELHVHPFSFLEYLQYNKVHIANKWEYVQQKAKINKLFEKYTECGSMPESIDFSDEVMLNYSDSLMRKVILDDIVKRFKVSSVDVIERLFRYGVTNVGTPLSYNSLSKALVMGGETVSAPTIERFISFYESAFVLSRLERFTWKSKERLRNLSKYYPVDHGFINLFATSTRNRKDKVIECMVHNFLTTKYDHVYYGTDSSTGKEIDFIIDVGDGKYVKIQVCSELIEANKKRELGNFVTISKYLRRGNNILVTLGAEEQEHRIGGQIVHELPLKQLLLDQNDLL